MEGFSVLAGLGLFGVAIVLPIWMIGSILRLRRDAENDRRENQEHWQDLTARLFVLEARLKESEPASAPTRNAVPEGRDVAPPIQTPPMQTPAPAEPISTPPFPPSPAPSVPFVKPPETLIPTRESAPPPSRLPEPVVSPSAPPPPRVQPPVFAKPHPEPPASRELGLEEMLGTNWLNKIGVGILVLGLAFFLAYQLQNLGPAGKVLLGVALSSVMIAVGVRYDSSERYRILARASAAGGWSLLYFVSYAVYHVSATHIIDSQELDFFLMLAVAAAIVWYSLRYRSQATTALALVLSYLTVGIHHTSFYSLAASVILAVTVVALALRMNWFALELFGILATYFNHVLWVWPVVEAMGPNRVEFPEFRTSIALLAFYWLLFRFSYIYRTVSDSSQESLSTASALANGFCLLAVLKYQSVHPEWAFWGLIVLGVLELGLSVLAVRRRRAAFVVLATLGSVLLVAAIPFRYSGSSLSLLWLAGAQAFLLAGVFLPEVVFRRIGLVTLAAVGVQMFLDTGASLLELRFTNDANALPAYPEAVLFAAAAALCYFNSHWVQRRWQQLFQHQFDANVIAGLTYLGGLFLLVAAWFAWPGMWTAVAWGVLALLMNFIARKFLQAPLALQGNLVAVASIIRLLTLNMFANQQWHGVSLRLVTAGATALLLYAAAPLAGTAEDQAEGAWPWFTAAYTWAASILFGVLLWTEMSALNLALGWMALGLVLLEIGLQLKAGFLRWQGYTALAASFFQLFIADLDFPATASFVNSGLLDPGVTRVVPLAAAYFYSDWRLRLSRRSTRESDLGPASTVFSYLGVIAVAALLYIELMPSWVAAGWAALALAMIAAAIAVKRLDYLRQSLLLAAAVAFRAVSYNFFLTPSQASFWQSQRYYVGVAITLLFAALPLAFLLRKSGFGLPASEFPLDHRPEQFFFFVPFGLLTIVIALESTHGRLTVNIGMEGLAVFLLAILVGERSFRLAGLALLLLCVAKIFLIDVWGLDPQSRYITLIVLGAALLLVSFLYTRHKEKFQRYL
ncbi:MAG TPA: DUF2339 domain-containing protein [Terriglobales bacterium]|nr:DUF2339 domain-containing protein [Terriglobales bacterium]